MNDATEAVIWTLKTILLELDRFRESSEDPSSESLSIDSLMTIFERTLSDAEAMTDCLGCAEQSPPGARHAIDCPNRRDEVTA